MKHFTSHGHADRADPFIQEKTLCETAKFWHVYGPTTPFL